jgi:hypothetical protein
LYITNNIYSNKAFSFYEEFSEYWQKHSLFGIGHKKSRLYIFLLSFITDNYGDHRKMAEELIKYDYFCHNHTYGLPAGISSHNPQNINDITYYYTKDKIFVERYLEKLTAKSPREIKKLIHIEYFNVDPITYQKKDDEFPLMFVYDEIKQKAAKVIDLTTNNTFINYS